MQRVGIVGGGILGLATAYVYQKKHPQSRITLIEKESAIGLHQSSHNSGVLHCGLYYKPGSLKAKLATQGIQKMTRFCEENKIPHEICGKVVVATQEQEVSLLYDLAKRGQQNGLQGLKTLSKEELKKREPFVYAKEALLVPEEGIVSFLEVMKKLQELIKGNNGSIEFNQRAQSTKNTPSGLVLKTQSKEFEFDLLINCAGLHSDTNYQNLSLKKRPLRIVPFRGEYFALRPEAHKLVNHLIYPVPNPQYPFLGVHFTRMIDGGREVGPNAVLAFKREGYNKDSFSLKDTWDWLSYSGLYNFASKHLFFSLKELSSSFFKSVFLKKAQMLIPDLKLHDLSRGTAGVRAQAMAPTGELLMDFEIYSEDKQIHVLNAPSPGATASLAIAEYIVDNFTK